jgi:hypothetical protein
VFVEERDACWNAPTLGSLLGCQRAETDILYFFLCVWLGIIHTYILLKLLLLVSVAADKMGKVVSTIPPAMDKKMACFSADIAAKKTYVPSQLGSPFFVAKHIVR